ncbi:MAG TPA: cytochrome c oxidase subunit II [Candidatus Poseidoniales archaeon]|nr:cytochrome c oxidase subunit II [Candidatus Poseidoniales archaeon]
MAGVTPLYDAIWEDYIIWSLFVGAIAFGWLYHHSFFYRSNDGESPNVDNLEVGVFPIDYDNLRLEVAWVILPSLLIVWLTYISWAPLDAVWSQTGPDGYHGSECAEGESSDNYVDDDGYVYSACYHEISIVGQQWFWNMDCEDLSEDLCSTDFSTSGGETRPLLNLKVGETYLARLTSTDVTHAPKFNGFGMMEDIVPGQVTFLWLPAIEEGDSLMLCAEFCGDNHAYMTAQVNVSG